MKTSEKNNGHFNVTQFSRMKLYFHKGLCTYASMRQEPYSHRRRAHSRLFFIWAVLC